MSVAIPTKQPVLARRTPPPRAAPTPTPAPTGDGKGTVLVPAKFGRFNVTKASEITQSRGINMLIYGVSGSGKTTLAATAADSPHGNRVLYIDLEGGTWSISDRDDIDVITIDRWEDLGEVLTELSESHTHPYKTFVLDSLSEVQELAKRSVVGAKGTEAITRQDWGKTNERVINMVRGYRTLTKTRGINTLFTALENEIVDEATKMVRIRPGLTPGATKNVGAAVDHVGYLTWNQRTGKRILQLVGDGKVLAKTRQPMAGEGRLPDKLEDPSMATLFNAVRGEWKEPESEVMSDQDVVASPDAE